VEKSKMSAETISYVKGSRSGLVSVIIPTRNGERFIGQSLASVARQTDTNWEVIVVEDGSQDRTSQLVQEFSRKHRWHRVDYSRNDRNCGAAHTRNVAFRKARGEFVALLDVDDRWLPDHLQVATAALAASGKDIAYSSSIMFEDQTDLLLGVWGPTSGEIATLPHSLYGRCFVTPSATVMRRQVLEDVGPWDTFYRYCEDYGYWMRCIAAGKTFQYVPGCHCLYRKNHEGATTQRLCGTLEEVAEIAERYMKLPGVQHKICRRFAAKAFYMAAQFHLTQDPRRDPSADPTRTAALLLHAWRLRRRHIDWLLQGAARSVKNLFLRPRQPVSIASVVTPPAATTQIRTAA
jgi:Glycosyl transferase family 2